MSLFTKLYETRERESEFTANVHLGGHSGSGSEQHHVFIKSKGKRKSISGPFPSKEAAEAHPTRKYGDGVCTSQMCESMPSDGGELDSTVESTLIEAQTQNLIEAISRKLNESAKKETWTQVGKHIHIRKHDNDDGNDMHTVYVSHNGSMAHIDSFDTHEQAMDYANHNKSKSPKIKHHGGSCYSAEGFSHPKSSPK